VAGLDDSPFLRQKDFFAAHEVNVSTKTAFWVIRTVPKPVIRIPA
jgi:hypothetical protein